MLTPPNRVTYAEMMAWSELTKHVLLPSEVQVLRAIDTLRFRVVNEDV